MNTTPPNQKRAHLCTATQIHCCWGKRRCGRPGRACWSCSRCGRVHQCRKSFPTGGWGSLARRKCAGSHSWAPSWTWNNKGWTIKLMIEKLVYDNVNKRSTWFVLWELLGLDIRCSSKLKCTVLNCSDRFLTPSKKVELHISSIPIGTLEQIPTPASSLIMLPSIFMIPRHSGEG